LEWFKGDLKNMAKIMIVDDSDTIRHQLRDDLEGEGHIVLDASDGQQGLDVLGANQDLDLIICDVNMPVMDGLTMCEKIKNEELTLAPIFMLTTETSKDMKMHGKRIGIRAWITKPYIPDTLLSAIQMVVV
jgi:two-component system, chemotaxis family, chemotaxis protein CheY